MRTDRRRLAAATLIASAALALGTAGPAAAAPSAQNVDAPATSSTPSSLPGIPTGGATPEMRPLSLAAEVPILEDPAELAAGQAATLPATGVDIPIFLTVAALGGLLGIGLCITAARRA